MTTCLLMTNAIRHDMKYMAGELWPGLGLIYSTPVTAGYLFYFHLSARLACCSSQPHNAALGGAGPGAVCMLGHPMAPCCALLTSQAGVGVGLLLFHSLSIEI